VKLINIHKVQNFQEHKKNLISLINLIPKTPLTEKGQKIIHTDYTITPSMHREYKNYFMDYIAPSFVNEFQNNFNCEELALDTLWFQIYEKNNYHSWHTHPNSHFTNILYIQLPLSTKTKIIDTEKNPIEVPIEEGDILSFPAFLKHRSPANYEEQSKIIISFNTNILR